MKYAGGWNFASLASMLAQTFVWDSYAERRQTTTIRLGARYAMSTPTQFGLPQHQPGGNNNRILAIVLVTMGLAGMLCCGGGICGGVLFSVVRSSPAVQQVTTSIQSKLPQPQPSMTSGWDWMAMEQLARAYTMALDAVVADKQVIEKLGKPVQPVIESEQLFRRERNGALSNEEEAIEFDIAGPKGKAVVRVVGVAATGPPGAYPWSQAKKITVTLSDDTEIDVPVPAEKAQLEP
jgi:hypothetical protein